VAAGFEIDPASFFALDEHEIFEELESHELTHTTPQPPKQPRTTPQSAGERTRKVDLPHEPLHARKSCTVVASNFNDRAGAQLPGNAMSQCTAC
jgi:hypothetical protein